MVFVGLGFGVDSRRASATWNAQVWKAIKSVCAEFGLKACRADMREGCDAFIETIETYIDRC